MFPETWIVFARSLAAGLPPNLSEGFTYQEVYFPAPKGAETELPPEYIKQPRDRWE